MRLFGNWNNCFIYLSFGIQPPSRSTEKRSYAMSKVGQQVLRPLPRRISGRVEGQYKRLNPAFTR
jgi:hypothetical protein